MKVTQENPVSEELKLPETVRKNNQELLQKTIDKLIADNEKCLMVRNINFRMGTT